MIFVKALVRVAKGQLPNALVASLARNFLTFTKKLALQVVLQTSLLICLMNAFLVNILVKHAKPFHKFAHHVPKD